MIAENCALFQSRTCLPRQSAGVGLTIWTRSARRTATMPQFNDTELTAAVIRSFEETPDPRVKFLLEELVKSLHDYVRRDRSHLRGMGIRDRFPDPRRPEMHPDPAGVHPAVRRARRFHAGGCGEPPRARRRHRDHGARSVLCRRAQGDAARQRYLAAKPDGREDVRAKPRHRSERQAACRRSGRRLARRRRRLLRLRKSRPMRRKGRHRGRASSPTPTAASSSAPSCPAATRSRPTARSAR